MLLLDHLSHHTLTRARDLRAIGINATAISRAVEEGALVRVGRGLYQKANAETAADISLAEAEAEAEVVDRIWAFLGSAVRQGGGGAYGSTGD